MFSVGDRSASRTLSEHLNDGLREHKLHAIPEVGGLHYFPGFLSSEAQRRLVAHIDGEPWRGDLERRVQHYGWLYDYRTRSITPDMNLGALPQWVSEVAHRLYAETSLFDRVPDQAIVNEYLPGQGIALHADRSCFGGAVATVSLEDDWEMRLRGVGSGVGDDRRILLERGSVLVLTGASRFHWMHGIDKRKKEKDAFGVRERRRRLSLTYRTVLVGERVTGRRLDGEDAGARRG